MNPWLPSEHYERPEVKKEIADYCKNRWVAIHCEAVGENGMRIMIRYDRGKPLTINSESEFTGLINRYMKYRPRAFYATAHIYSRFKIREDVLDRSNIVYSSPVWDIDSKDGDWRRVIKKAQEIVGLLDSFGVSKSVFVKWSGRGAHVHINPFCFSVDVRRKIEPIDIAYSITNFITNRLEHTEGVIVESRIDIQRVFTSPLSLHRVLDRVAICLLPEKLEEFDIGWTDPKSYVHFPDSWRRFSESEGDDLAEKAFTSTGPYVTGKHWRRKHKPLDTEILETIGKFGNQL
ncbi:MAG: hypothetical protein FGF52_02645 [Candidatus Brockarchaeota archaeon]|nr:hypothetical protein [Candidatus Brockarchaeota archaeon]